MFSVRFSNRKKRISWLQSHYFTRSINPRLTFSKNGLVDLSLGIGRAFNVSDNSDDFAETVLAANQAVAKYWWLSGSTNLGMSLLSGIHGLTVTTGHLSSIGWHVGLGLAFLFG